ncbi:GerAB/ArcD/ProY family transporter [Salipaludibacillus sp. CF4.18]|uniref:GerAB/ArcD/ProY family transporter n=1 Tax=Salipaludibacillus sp. CF4.18 TaxID=3373081 RepID=UPI003EE52CD4
MSKETSISCGQMAWLFLAFMVGSAIINIPQPLVQSANNGAWLSIVIATGYGLLLLSCIFYLYRKNPYWNLFDFSMMLLGKWVTVIISIPIILLFFLILSYIVIDIGAFFNIALMRETPNYIIHGLILLVAGVAVKAGIEVMARMFVLLLTYVLLFTFTVVILAFPFYEVGNLLPVFPEGLKPVIHGTYMILGFPYGELVVISFLLPFVSKERNQSLKKYMFLVLLVYGGLLIMSILTTIMALGPLTGTLKFSLFQLARLINIREIITRIESFIGIALVVGSFMKTTIMLFILKETLARLLKLKDKQIIIFPILFITLLLTLTMFANEMEFFDAVFVYLPLLITVILVLPLIIITILAMIKNDKIKPTGKSV